MSRESMGIALNKMRDSEICEQVASGDLSGLGDLEFTDVEREVLIGAAEDYPDVGGFGFDFSFNFSAPPPKTVDFTTTGQFGEALHYAYGRNAGVAAIGGHRL